MMMIMIISQIQRRNAVGFEEETRTEMVITGTLSLSLSLTLNIHIHFQILGEKLRLIQLE